MTMPARTNSAGRGRWNRLAFEEPPLMWEHLTKLVKDALEEDDGVPPFTAVINSESDEYHKLVALAQMNDPRYVNDIEAKKRLAELSLKYGPPPDYQVPIGQFFPNNPRSEAAAMG